MEQDPNEEIRRHFEDIEMRIAARFRAWGKAYEEHLALEPGSVFDLANGVRALRHLEATDPGWREKNPIALLNTAPPQEVPNILHFSKLQALALGFEQQLKTALSRGGEDGRRFARQLSKAFAIPEDQLHWTISLAGEVLLTWIEISRQRLQNYKAGSRLDFDTRPTPQEIRSSIVRRMEQQQLKPPSARSWQRVWEDPFVAALMRCP